MVIRSDALGLLLELMGICWSSQFNLDYSMIFFKFLMTLVPASPIKLLQRKSDIIQEEIASPFAITISKNNKLHLSNLYFSAQMNTG